MEKTRYLVGYSDTQKMSQSLYGDIYFDPEEHLLRDTNWLGFHVFNKIPLKMLRALNISLWKFGAYPEGGRWRLFAPMFGWFVQELQYNQSQVLWCTHREVAKIYTDMKELADDLITIRTLKPNDPVFSYWVF